MTVLEERGLFWWYDEPIPENQFAPDTCLTGLLSVDGAGHTRLELDSYFPGGDGPMTPMTRSGKAIERHIRGILTKSGKHVLLVGPTGNGGQFKTNGVSFERYIAKQCLVADESGGLPPDLAFTSIDIPLAGFEEWLRLAAIEVTYTGRTVSAKYKRNRAVSYATGEGRLTISFESSVSSTGAVFGAAVSLQEMAVANLSFKGPIRLEKAIAQYHLLEDLLLLLTGSDRTLDWPSVRGEGSLGSLLYFPKIASRSAAPPKAHECCTSFPQLRSNFGDIWSEWKKKREAFGPGFYLYLGTRRGITLYIENRFVNLVFGLEAFNRRKYPPAITDSLDAKIERIVAQVTLPKDKKWLTGMLDRAKEPPLGQRLYATLSAVPLGLEETRLKDFCLACAKSRNDISHFGGQRKDATYNDFILDLENKAQSLASLYQALLMHEVGVDHGTIRKWLFDGFGSFAIKYHFVKAGLLDARWLDARG